MLANKSLKVLTKKACQHFQPNASAFFDIVHSSTQSKKSFALTFKHLFSAINNILKQLQL